MLNNIKIDLNALEHMIFFWQSTMDREKVAEAYLAEVAALPEMQILYDGEFNEESVRKVLSAVTNRELLNTSVTKEKQFWNNNMWMTEDPEMMNLMIAPLKVMNLDSMKATLNERADIPYDEIEVIVIPAFKEDCMVQKNQLYVNFFKVMVDIFGGTGDVTIGGMSPADYISAQIMTMDGVAQK